MHLRTQYKVNAVMTTQLLSLLLLMSGNVEENPGPVGDEPNHFNIKNILREISGLMEWKSLGMELGLDPAMLGDIEHNCHGIVEDCGQAMVEFWITSDTSASWDKLAAALEAISQHVKAKDVRVLGRKEASPSTLKAPPNSGNASTIVEKASPTLGKAPPTSEKAPPTGKASTTVEKVPPTGKASPTVGKASTSVGKASPTIQKAPTTVGKAPPTLGRAPPTLGRAPYQTLCWEHLEKLLKQTRHAADKWRAIGMELGFITKELDAIVQVPGCVNDEDYYAAMLRRWLEWAPPNHLGPTHSALVAAIRKIGMEKLANDLEQQRKELFDLKKLYDDAMKTGSVKRTIIKCLIVGAAGVGKTSIKHLLLNKDLPKKHVSTGMAENPAVAISRDVSISRAFMKTDNDSWNVIHNDKDLIKIIAEIIKAQAYNKKPQEKPVAIDIAAPNEKPQEKSQANSTTSESRIMNSAEMVKLEGTTESQDDSIVNDFISEIMAAEVFQARETVLTTKWIHIIDSGGQPEFHDLLPVFVPNTSVVLFVFKLSEGLDEKPTVEYYGPDGPIGGSYKSYLTHRQILEHCLQVFRAQDPKKCPTILLIGTHKDHPEQRLKIDELQKCLKPFRQEVIHFGSDQPIALLNCLSKDKEKELVEVVRKEILKVSDNVESEETPMAWFILELALKQASQSLNSKSKGILSLKQCEEEANKIAYFKKNSGQFDAAMKHFVNHNIFLHYPEVLPDVVFCDPQVLLTLITQIVQYHYKLKHGLNTAIRGTTFMENAYISADILTSISSQYGNKDGILPSASFFKLLSHLKLISAVSTSGNSNMYLMPALLSNVDNLAAKLEEIRGNKHLPPLCISFDGGCVPSGVFCSLVATLLQKGWKLCMKDEKPYCCFRNCITFSYQRRTITLVDFYSHFSIYMCIPTFANALKISPLTIRNIIHDSIKHLQCTTLSFQDAIRCPSHPEAAHVALWHLPEPSDEEEYYTCTVDDTCTGSMPGDYQIWRKVQPPAPTPPHLVTQSDQSSTLTESISHSPAPNPVSKDAASMFHSYSATLRNVNPDDISAHLLANNVISYYEKAEIDNHMFTLQERMDKLLAAVQRAINIDSQNYETFLDILWKEGKYAALVKEMRENTAMEEPTNSKLQ